MGRKSINLDSKKGKAAFFQARLGLNAANFTGKPGDATIVGFTSRVQGEGVSTTISGLAKSISTLAPGSVLVIDSNPVGTRIADILGIHPRPLTNRSLDSKNFDIADYIVKNDGDDLALISFEFEAAETYPVGFEFAQYFSDLRELYDTILVDIGSWDQLSPASWAEQMDHLVLVIDSETTTREKLQNFKNIFDQSGLELSGFILNKQQRPIPEFIYNSL